MEEKQWGTLLIITAILMTAVSIIVKIYRDVLNECISCSYLPYMLVWFIAGLMLVTGLMLKRSHELEDIIAESKLKANREFKEAKKKEREKEKFQEFLKDFTKDESEIIEILHTYEGITLKHLENKAGYTKGKLARIISSLEKRQILTIMDDKKIYLLKLSK